MPTRLYFDRSRRAFWRHYRAYFAPGYVHLLTDGHADQLAWLARAMAHNAREAGLLS